MFVNNLSSHVLQCLFFLCQHQISKLSCLSIILDCFIIIEKCLVCLVNVLFEYYAESVLIAKLQMKENLKYLHRPFFNKTLSQFISCTWNLRKKIFIHILILLHHSNSVFFFRMLFTISLSLIFTSTFSVRFYTNICLTKFCVAFAFWIIFFTNIFGAELDIDDLIKNCN